MCREEESRSVYTPAHVHVHFVAVRALAGHARHVHLCQAHRKNNYQRRVEENQLSLSFWWHDASLHSVVDLACHVLCDVLVGDSPFPISPLASFPGLPLLQNTWHPKCMSWNC